MQTKIKYLNPYFLDPNKIMVYTRQSDSNSNSEAEDKIIGQVSTHYGFYHKFCSYNKFTKQTFLVPLKYDGWLDVNEAISIDYSNGHDKLENETSEAYEKRKLLIFKAWVKKNVCDPEFAFDD